MNGPSNLERRGSGAEEMRHPWLSDLKLWAGLAMDGQPGVRVKVIFSSRDLMGLLGVPLDALPPPQQGEV